MPKIAKGEKVRRSELPGTVRRSGAKAQPNGGSGPSDPRSTKTTSQKRGEGETFGGVDVEGHTKRELYERARRLGVEERSKMSKHELARAISGRQ